MAQYRVDNRILSEEEYRNHCSSNWITGLFFVGAIVAAWGMNSIVPEEWPKYLRFTAVTVFAIVGGGLFGALAEHIRKAMFFALSLGVLAGIGYWMWRVV